MMNECFLRITRDDYNVLLAHLFPGDRDEHGAVLLAGISNLTNRPTLYVREVHLAQEGTDYTEGKYGYRALSPKFIHRLITRARDERLVYLAVHNHESDLNVEFSAIDIASHERGYPALLQIARGMAVGALVLGRRSMQADIWMPNGKRLSLKLAVVVGTSITELAPREKKTTLSASTENFDRQIRMFGLAGQEKLSRASVGIIGLGGIGSLVTEYLGRLGVGRFVLVDNDLVESSNLSRIVGATHRDSAQHVAKVDVAQRLLLQSNPSVVVETITDDVAKDSVSKRLLSCDYLFLAADSMRARLVFNALVHQYFIPGVQLGSKIRANSEGTVIDILSANRPVRPGHGCLWCNQLIDPNQIAKESKTDAERKTQAYGVEEPNPSVITLNAISAAHAVNDFALDYLGIRPEIPLTYEHFHPQQQKRLLAIPRRDDDCTECARSGLRYGRGDLVSLPCLES